MGLLKTLGSALFAAATPVQAQEVQQPQQPPAAVAPADNASVNRPSVLASDSSKAFQQPNPNVALTVVSPEQVKALHVPSGEQAAAAFAAEAKVEVAEAQAGSLKAETPTPDVNSLIDATATRQIELSKLVAKLFELISRNPEQKSIVDKVMALFKDMVSTMQEKVSGQGAPAPAFIPPANAPQVAAAAQVQAPQPLPTPAVTVI